MIKTAFQYHERTSYHRHAMEPHSLDWRNQPTVFKQYPGITPVAMPQPGPFPQARLQALLKDKGKDTTVRPIDLETLSTLLALTYSLTAKAHHPGGDFYYRNAASAGALYPTELYLAASALEGLEDGLYHFSLSQHALVPLRKGDLSGSLKPMAPFPGERPTTLTFFLSAIFFRSAWKYRDRSYRYHLLDTGHVLENLLLALRALRLPSFHSYDFHDVELNQLLGLDQTREVCLAVAGIPGTARAETAAQTSISHLSERLRAASRVAPVEQDYPAIREVHEASRPVAANPATPVKRCPVVGPEPAHWTPIKSSSPWPETMNFHEAVFSRRSKRNFVPEAVPRKAMEALLDCLCSPEPGIFLPDLDESFPLAVGLLLDRAEGMEAGLYMLDVTKGKYGGVLEGSFTKEMAHVCLNQAWLSNAAVHFLFMADFGSLETAWGPRGYRYAMMTAGRLGQRLYLTSTSLGLGCCGIGAFYDSEAGRILGLHGFARLLYLVAVGVTKH